MKTDLKWLKFLMALISPVKKNNRTEPALKKKIKNQAVINIQEKKAYEFECH